MNIYFIIFNYFSFCDFFEWCVSVARFHFGVEFRVLWSRRWSQETGCHSVVVFVTVFFFISLFFSFVSSPFGLFSRLQPKPQAKHFNILQSNWTECSRVVASMALAFFRSIQRKVNGTKRLFNSNSIDGSFFSFFGRLSKRCVFTMALDRFRYSTEWNYDKLDEIGAGNGGQRQSNELLKAFSHSNVISWMGNGKTTDDCAKTKFAYQFDQQKTITAFGFFSSRFTFGRFQMIFNCKNNKPPALPFACYSTITEIGIRYDSRAILNNQTCGTGCQSQIIRKFQCLFAWMRTNKSDLEFLRFFEKN